VQGGVDVVEQAVADVVGVAGCGGYLLPVVELLRDGAVAVVVSGEGVECLRDLLAWVGCRFHNRDRLPPSVAQREQRFSVVLAPNPTHSRSAIDRIKGGGFNSYHKYHFQPTQTHQISFIKYINSRGGDLPSASGRTKRSRASPGSATCTAPKYSSCRPTICQHPYPRQQKSSE
jgi:hypothetical protein